MFKLLQKNLEPDEIAKTMQVSVHTVKSHLSKIKRVNIN